VTQLVTLLQAYPSVLNGRKVVVSGFYHHGCPYCTWDAPPSLTPGSSWTGPSIVVALPDTAQPDAVPAWVSWWRTLPFLGHLASPSTITDLPEGANTFSGTIVPCAADSCGGPSYVMRVLSISD
jgi:hypothetical protein